MAATTPVDADETDANHLPRGILVLNKSIVPHTSVSTELVPVRNQQLPPTNDLSWTAERVLKNCTTSVSERYAFARY